MSSEYRFDVSSTRNHTPVLAVSEPGKEPDEFHPVELTLSVCVSRDLDALTARHPESNWWDITSS